MIYCVVYSGAVAIAYIIVVLGFLLYTLYSLLCAITRKERLPLERLTEVLNLRAGQHQTN